MQFAAGPRARSRALPSRPHAGKPPRGAQRSRAGAVSGERGAAEVAARPARLPARVGGAARVTVRAQRPPRGARSARSLGAGPAESGGQRWSCCHDNPGGLGPRASGLLPGGRRRGGRGRPLSVASARPRAPRRVPGEAGAASASSPWAPSLRRRRSAGRAGRQSPRGLRRGRQAPTAQEDPRARRRRRRVPAVELFTAFAFQIGDSGWFLNTTVHMCDLIKHSLLSLKRQLFMTSPLCQRHLPGFFGL